ncbi:MAG: hypothetical protein NZM40_08060 [Sphingomonadaceae bacterium]|nr:hypothetical protein [Sphingomonadaceae bacterium]MDW8414586.1 hypothetical protein [Thermaurantiacus sp.]
MTEPGDRRDRSLPAAAPEDRRQRLGRALRANLARRRAQKRAQGEDQADP